MECKEKEVLIAVRAEVESADHWRVQFKTHGDVFKSQGVSMVHMGVADETTVIAIFETNDPEELLEYSTIPLRWMQCPMTE